MAMAERHLAARFGDDLVDHRTWVIAGDGCLMEGVSHEAISLAGRLKLNQLTVLWDDNDITIDGDVRLSDATDQLARFKAAGLGGQGHRRPRRGPDPPRPALGHAAGQADADRLQDQDRQGRRHHGRHPQTHGAALGDDEVAATRQALGWRTSPSNCRTPSRRPGAPSGAGARKARKAWEARLAASPQAADFERAMAGDLPAGAFEPWTPTSPSWRRRSRPRPRASPPARCWSELFGRIPEMVGGSADLTGSNNTFVKNTPILDAPDYAGRYVN